MVQQFNTTVLKYFRMNFIFNFQQMLFLSITPLPIRIVVILHYYWATVCKTVRFMLSDRCPVCLSVLSACNVGILWPNGNWMDRDETWHVVRPRPRPQCVRRDKLRICPHVCCCQTAERIKIPLGRDVDLRRGDIVFDGDTAPPKKGTAPPLFGPCLL